MTTLEAAQVTVGLVSATPGHHISPALTLYQVFCYVILCMQFSDLWGQIMIVMSQDSGVEFEL